MSAQASLHKAFEAGLLYMQTPSNDRMLLQVCSDFDVAKRELDALFGKSTKLMGVFEEAPDNAFERARSWALTTEKQMDAAFRKYFRPFKDPDQVLHKPVISRLVLMPYFLDQPFVPNDLGDRKNSGD